ncbi:MAG: hypothetical protein OEZ47_01840 [Gammaproteobacteria bacterium]|nr:hypothetical protein [Gammaproteobacteria bacterium]
MKILLFGEFSGVHLNLKRGLISLDQNVTIASTGDGWKGFGADISLGKGGAGLAGKLSRIATPIISRRDLIGYDVIQLISPFSYFTEYGLYSFQKYLIENNERTFLVSAGCDYYFRKNIQKSFFKTPLCDRCLAIDYGSKVCPYESEGKKQWNERILRYVNGVIPLAPFYEYVYRFSDKIRPMIPFPIDTSQVQSELKKPGKKIKIFHGINRRGFKGSDVIEKAFDRLQSKYPKDLELIIAKGMPYKIYLETLRNVDVVLDQLYSPGWGINTLITMLMGKLVITHYKDDGVVNHNEASVVNVVPSVEGIVESVEWILENKNNYVYYGERNRLYVEKYHDHIHIAKKFLSAWNG